MDRDDQRSRRRADEPIQPRAHRLIRRLTWLYGVCTLAAALALAPALLPARVLTSLQALAHEGIVGGLSGEVLTTLLLAFMSMLATFGLTYARFHSTQGADGPDGRAARGLRRLWQPAFAQPGTAARVGQALIVPTGAVLILVAARLLWRTGAPVSDPTAGNIAAAFVFGLAFVSLMAERLVNDFPAAQLPEVPALRRILLLCTALLAADAALELGRTAGLHWVRWPGYALAVLPALIALELMLRALARLFLPAPRAAEAQAVADSALAGLLTGATRSSPGNLLRTHLGLDFARSWAISFLSAALLPALIGTAFLCWGLSGLKMIDYGQRGVYERFGAPIAVLGPGLHLLVPWPFGRLRMVDYGTIHSVAIGVLPSAAKPLPLIGAEATPPLSFNRLWETVHPNQASYIVASAGTGSQSFQSVSTEIYVLYRVGLTNQAALDSVYNVADPQALIRDAASRLVLRYFNSRTLSEVIGKQPEDVADTLRNELATSIGADHAGIDIVSVLIEEIHPPAGAAAAYHEVQAAEIQASASIANEQGRAARVIGVAHEQAHQRTTSADAQATETIDAANAAAYKFAADRRSYAEGGRSFLIERRDSDLVAALRRAPLTLIDQRLSASEGPVIDLRSLLSGRATKPATAGSISKVTPLTGIAGQMAAQEQSFFFNEGAAPPSQQTAEVRSQIKKAMGANGEGLANGVTGTQDAGNATNGASGGGG